MYRPEGSRGEVGVEDPRARTVHRTTWLDGEQHRAGRSTEAQPLAVDGRRLRFPLQRVQWARAGGVEHEHAPGIGEHDAVHNERVDLRADLRLRGGGAVPLEVGGQDGGEGRGRGVRQQPHAAGPGSREGPRILRAASA